MRGFGCKMTIPPRAWQRMLSGRRLDLLDPSPLDIEIEDIAHGLARVARWNGQTKGKHSFSVAQHAVLVERITCYLLSDPALERGRAAALTKVDTSHILLTALLHDAAEYVIGDMITPLKSVLSTSYKDVEHRLMCAIHMRFGLPAEPNSNVIKLIKKADRIAAFYEATMLAGFTKMEAEPLFGNQVRLPKAVLELLEPLATEGAQVLFLARFGEISTAVEFLPPS
jgi:uncharacterized protein